MEGEYALDAPRWLLPSAIIATMLALLVVFVYVRASSAAVVRLCAATLKILAVLAIAVCLLEPIRIGWRPRPHVNVMALLVDDSHSMQIKSDREGPPRHVLLQPHLAGNSDWQSELEVDFDVRRYRFASQLQSTDDFDDLTFDGHASTLVTSVETIANRFGQRPVAGMMLFTDGNATDVSNSSIDWSKLKFPVYPVVADANENAPDLRIAHVGISQANFEAAPVTIHGQLASTAMAGKEVVVALIDQQGEVLEQQVVAAPKDDAPHDFRFRFRPDSTGVQFVRVSAYLKSEEETFANNETKAEVTLANNTRVVSVDQRRGPFRVLYLSGRPNWEFKFLRRALSEDDEIQLVGLIRIARKEPKFSFRDRGVDSTNPLFTGFDEETGDDAEQYDEPVLIRLGVQDATDLPGGFPELAEELFNFHAVILDDIEAKFFSPDQQLLLRRFVSERGGGLLMLGGQESFSKGKYAQTVLGELAPVYMGSQINERPRGPFQFQLSREGWLQPWLRLRNTQSAERKRLAEASPLKVMNLSRDIKPGASVMATVQTESGKELPMLATQQFGAGRSAALLAGDMWRWAMHDTDDTRDDLPQWWRQCIRYLVADVPRRLEISTDQTGDTTKPVQLRVQLRDEEYQPLDNAQIELTVQTPTTSEFTLTARPSDQQAGEYIGEFWPRETGAYVVQAAATAPDGSPIDQREVGFISRRGEQEFDRLKTNREFLGEIADQSGGQIVSLDELDEFVAELPNRRVPVTQRWVYPVWHQGWVLAFAIGCLCAEWGLRRWKGLA